MRRLTAGVGVAFVLVLGLAGCGGSGDGKNTTSSSSSLPAATTSTTGSTATTATAASTATTRTGSPAIVGTTAATAGTTPGTPAPTARPAPSVVVTLYAQKGEIPPGRVDPLEAPAWRATGAGWDPGDLSLVVKRSDGPSVVLDVGAHADDSGRFEQTFVVLDVHPGTYAAIASQGDKRAEGSFVLS